MPKTYRSVGCKIPLARESRHKLKFGQARLKSPEEVHAVVGVVTDESGTGMAVDLGFSEGRRCMVSEGDAVSQ